MPARIMVINDRPSILRLMEIVLRKYRYDPIIYHHGRSPEDELFTHDVDVLFLLYTKYFDDDELAFLQTLRRHPPFAHIPILIHAPDLDYYLEQLEPFAPIFPVSGISPPRILVDAIEVALKKR